MGELSKALLAAVLVAPCSSLPAADGKGSRVEYLGGTLAVLTPKTDGILYTSFDEALFLQTRAVTVQASYESVNLLEYGQKASRRYALAIVVSPVLLLSKKRSHYLTVGYTDETGKQQAIVLRLDKDDVRAVLASLEAKTGRKVHYQDDEARKWGGE